MTIELTKELAISWHRNMWNEMADEIEKCKAIIDVCDFKHKYCLSHNFTCIASDCFLCAYTNYDCSECPLQWDSEMKEFMCENKYMHWDEQGLWLRCRNSTDWQEQAALARQIANLPER